MARTIKPATLLFIAITAAFLCAALFCPPLSHAKMKPIGEDVYISWAPAPPELFRLCCTRAPESWRENLPPWYGAWFNVPEACPYEDEIVPLIMEYEEMIVLWPPPESDILDVGPYATCDWDGLACKGDHFSGPDTDYGCVGVEIEKFKKPKGEGNFEVILPRQQGGTYWDSNGNPFIKIYFNELLSGQLEHWEAKIILGQCKEIENYETCPCADGHCDNDFPVTWHQNYTPDGCKYYDGNPGT